jgi:FMN phosphatase YigB (HAD superfamily)
MSLQADIQWHKIKAVIFDVDGTLYRQSKLRRRMLYDLLFHYALRPWQLQELRILQRFRVEREKRPGADEPDLENAQYAWCTDNGRIPVDKVKRVVNRWMFQHPNQYLLNCVYPGTQSFFDALRRQGIKIGIYSDYKAHDKLAAMGLAADVVVSSTDPEINRLKPAPDGLLYVAEKLGLTPSECLFIGDRQELDGVCAEQAGMPYLIVDKQPFDRFDFYRKLEDQASTSSVTIPTTI